MGIATRNKQNKLITNRILAKQAPWTPEELVDWAKKNGVV